MPDWMIPYLFGPLSQFDPRHGPPVDRILQAAMAIGLLTAVAMLMRRPTTPRSAAAALCVLAWSFLGYWISVTSSC